jgi:hypothetical protein
MGYVRLIGSFLPSVSIMDRSSELRKMATECLNLARRAPDAGARMSLLTMAQNLLDLANAPAVKEFDDILQAFNDQQMVKH